MVVLGEHREAVQHQHPQSVRIPTKIFSGNGVSMAAMCADSHQHRPRCCGHGGHRQILFSRLALGVKFSGWNIWRREGHERR